MEEAIKQEPAGEGRQSEKENNGSKESVGGSSEGIPAHHARRPPNGFLLFCKRHRDIVSEKNPSLENRGVTKLLGNWWRTLEESEREQYKELARQNKEVFIANNPQFTWYKLPAPPLRTLVTRPSNRRAPKLEPTDMSTSGPITPGKLADESQLGGITSLMSISQSPPSTPQPSSPPALPSPSAPPKKRFLLQSRAKTKSEEDEKRKHKKLKEKHPVPTCTQQEIIDTVVDASFEHETPNINNNSEIHRNLNLIITNEHAYQKKIEVKVEEEESPKNYDTIVLSYQDIPSLNEDINIVCDSLRVKKEEEDEEVDQKPCLMPQDNLVTGCDENLQTMLGKVSRDIEVMMNENEDELYTDDSSSYEQDDYYDYDEDDDGLLNGRRSRRLCKGKLYDEFIKDSVSKKKHKKDEDNNIEEEDSQSTNIKTSPKNNEFEIIQPQKASEIIKRKLDLESKEDHKVGRRQKFIKKKPVSKVQLIKEKRELQVADFDLNDKIGQLPILSFDNFLQKKRQRKKRLLNGLDHHRSLKKEIKQVHRLSSKNKLERFKHKEMNGRHSYIRSYKNKNNNGDKPSNSGNSLTQRADFADLTTLADTALTLLALGQTY